MLTNLRFFWVMLYTTSPENLPHGHPFQKEEKKFKENFFIARPRSMIIIITYYTMNTMRLIAMPG